MKSKKRDIILILCIVIAAAVLLCFGLSSRKTVTAADTGKTAAELPSDVQSASQEESGTEEAPVPEDIAAMADEFFAKYPADSYLIIQTSSSMYLPIPLSEEASFKIHFGEDEYNQVHIGKDSVFMEASTCDNQNCVGQGEVTLENRDSRVLFNMILCLPHELSLELYDRDETRDYLIGYFGISAAQTEASEAAQ